MNKYIRLLLSTLLSGYGFSQQNDIDIDSDSDDNDLNDADINFGDELLVNKMNICEYLDSDDASDFDDDVEVDSNSDSNDSILLEFDEVFKNSTDDLETLIKRLIQSGKSVNMTDYLQNTLLHYAVIKRNSAALNYLLSLEGIQFEKVNKDGKTALLLAVEAGDMKFIHRLIKSGADPNFSPKTPALHILVNKPTVCHMLIQLGADVNQTDHKGDTPLHAAVYSECLESICMLLCYGADPEIPNLADETPFIAALRRAHLRVHETMLDFMFEIKIPKSRSKQTLIDGIIFDSVFLNNLLDRDVESLDFEIDEFIFFRILMHCKNDVKTFAWIWPKLRSPIDMRRLVFFYVNDENVDGFIDVIVESENVDVAVRSFQRDNSLSEFINRICSIGLNLDKLSGLVCRLLCADYRLRAKDIHEVYSMFGFCELIRICRRVGSNDYDWEPEMEGLRVLFEDFDLDVDLKEVVKY